MRKGPRPLKQMIYQKCSDKTKSVSDKKIKHYCHYHLAGLGTPRIVEYLKQSITNPPPQAPQTTFYCLITCDSAVNKLHLRCRKQTGRVAVCNKSGT